MEGVRIVWGDLMNYQDVLNGVTGADYVLHVGGMVSPAADYFPKKTLKVNTTAAKHITDAVKAQPNADQIKVVYIGSVAQTGHRGAPIHWGRTGDPINISVYDHYAISKTIAERIFVESGIKHWVCLRQTGILCPELLLKGSDPITFHVPLNGVLEWATAEDSGRLLANVCEEEVPEEPTTPTDPNNPTDPGTGGGTTTDPGTGGTTTDPGTGGGTTTDPGTGGGTTTDPGTGGTTTDPGTGGGTTTDPGTGGGTTTETGNGSDVLE